MLPLLLSSSGEEGSVNPPSWLKDISIIGPWKTPFGDVFTSLFPFLSVLEFYFLVQATIILRCVVCLL